MGLFCNNSITIIWIKSKITLNFSIGGELKPELGANGELGRNVKIKQ